MDADQREGPPPGSLVPVLSAMMQQVVKVTQASDAKGESVMGLLCNLVSAMPLILEWLWILTV